MTDTGFRVGGDKAKIEAVQVAVDLDERDPEDINEHVRVKFFDIIAEPHESVYSFDRIWMLSATVFTTTKLWCYRLTSLILALPLMVIWGVYFALLSFCTIWICVPALKVYEVKLYCLRKYINAAVETFLEPCFLAIGKICYNIRITKQKPTKK